MSINNEENKYHFIANNIDVYFNKDKSDIDKYIVCTCAKNENDYLQEFVEHYINLGFDKIIICDNNDDNSIEFLLKEYISKGYVEIFDCRRFDSFQVQFYTTFSNYGNYKWCAYFDCDEFLELPGYISIKEFLDEFEDDIDGVCFNWLTFGTNHQYHKTHGLIQDRFKTPIRPITLFKENVFIKSILRGGKGRFKNCWFNGSHIPQCSNPVKFSIGGYHDVDYTMHTYSPPRYKKGYLKHYYTKSFDEWIKKASRGWPDGTPNLAAANFSICNNEYIYDNNNFTTAFFINHDNLENIASNWIEMLENYDVINVKNSKRQVYAFFTQLMSLISSVHNKVFMLSEDHIDDTMYNNLLEYALLNNNRLVFVEDDNNKKWEVFIKYSQKECYYIIDLN